MGRYPQEFRQILGVRFELRLADPASSEVDPRVAAHVPERPGFGVTSEKLQFLAGLPRIDGSPDSGDLEQATRAAAVKILHSRRTAVPDNEVVRRMKRIRIGGGDHGLLDLQLYKHLLVLGDSVGKTNVLRSVLRGITQRLHENEALIMLVDYRRGLSEFAGVPHLLRHAAIPSDLVACVKETGDSLRKRFHTDWAGPELFVVVDDYDLVVTRESNPLLPLREFLAHHYVGLHMVVASRSGGLPRDPLIRWLKETGSPGVLLNANNRPGQATIVRPGSGQQPVQLTWNEAQR
ncbi:hypothetical protein [Kibdelosporangium philippinense]|uniref:hypothetical protein n=1 Tax=Kibdelosporangium philippinense TaxID=211113 RepID=UPI00361C677B